VQGEETAFIRTPQLRTPHSCNHDVLRVLSSMSHRATCGLVYELLAGTLASYVLAIRCSVSPHHRQSTVGPLRRCLAVRVSSEGRWPAFHRGVELGFALLVGLSARVVSELRGLSFFQSSLYASPSPAACWSALDLPLLMRIVKDHADFNELVSALLTFDYICAWWESPLFSVFLRAAAGPFADVAGDRHVKRGGRLCGALSAAVCFSFAAVPFGLGAPAVATFLVGLPVSFDSHTA